LQLFDFIEADFGIFIVFEFFLMTTEFAEGFFKMIFSFDFLRDLSASAVSHMGA